MTVRLKVQYGTYPANTNLTTGAAEERRLLLEGLADTNTAAGVTYAAPVDDEWQTPTSLKIKADGTKVLVADNTEFGLASPTQVAALVAAVAADLQATTAATYWGRRATRKLLVWGDSTANQNAVDAPSTIPKYLGGAFAQFGVYVAENPVDVVQVSGNSGFRTDQIYPLFSAQVAAYSPDYVLMPVGTNDLTQGLGAAAALAGVMRMASLVESIGAVPILMTIAAGEAFSGGTQAIRAAWLSFNTQLRAIALAKRWPLLDAMYAYLDPASPVYAPLPGYTDGDVHPRTRGAQAIGAMFGALLRSLPRRQLFSAQGLTQEFVLNPYMTGTGGTKPAGVTGTSPDNTAYTISGATVLSSVESRADGGPGNWWKNDIQFDAPGTGGVNVLISCKTLAAAGLVVGDVLRAVADVQMEAGHRGVGGIDLRLRFVGSAGITWSQAYSPESANGTAPPGQFKTQLRVPEVAIPTGTTSIGLYVYILPASNAGVADQIACTLRIGGVSGIKV